MSSTVAANTIAGCALLFTIYHAWLQRRHNRLSVRPHLDWKTLSKRTNEGIYLQFYLRNTGIGPALIKSHRFLFDGAVLDCGNLDPVEVLVERCFLYKAEYKLLQHSRPGLNTAIKSGEDLCIAEVFFPCQNRESEVNIKTLADLANIEFVYESFYGERFTFTTKQD